MMNLRVEEVKRLIPASRLLVFRVQEGFVLFLAVATRNLINIKFSANVLFKRWMKTTVGNLFVNFSMFLFPMFRSPTLTTTMKSKLGSKEMLKLQVGSSPLLLILLG
jgi:hypothetical protein